MEESLDSLVEAYLQSKQVERRAAAKTLEAYGSDLALLLLFCEQQGLRVPSELKVAHLRMFLAQQLQNGLARSSIARRLSCYRSFFDYLVREGHVETNAARLLSLPKRQQRVPEFYYQEEGFIRVSLRHRNPGQRVCGPRHR
jgi:integrase/recombinase XerC